MRTIVQDNAWFLIPCTVFLLLGGILQLFVPQGPLHLWFNALHSESADAFFTYYTFLGDGWTVVALTLVLLFVRFRIALAVAVSNALCSIVTQTLKRVVFPDAVRPLAYFKDSAQLHLVPGVEVYSYNSFPSGHAAVAFATCLVLAHYTKRPLVKAGYFSLALTVAFSRVYLSQHFFGDIYAGAVIGLVLAGSTLVGLHKWGANNEWLNRSAVRSQEASDSRTREA